MRRLADREPESGLQIDPRGPREPRVEEGVAELVRRVEPDPPGIRPFGEGRR